MNRVPSIHIKETDLRAIIQEIVEAGAYRFYINVDYFTSKIVERAKTKSCSSRLIISSNNKIEKKTEKVKLAGRSETGIFAQILVLNRRILHHKGIVIPEPGTPDFLNMKEACKLATDFCNEVGIGIKEGYNEYIKIGLSMMKNFSIFKFKGLHSAICKRYDSILQLSTYDQFAIDETRSRYFKHINTRIGWVPESNSNIPEKLVCFMEAHKEAKKMGLSIELYIKAQFESMEWRSGVPDPYQLYGEKAVDRALKWCYENKVQLGKKKNSGINFKSIKNA